MIFRRADGHRRRVLGLGLLLVLSGLRASAGEAVFDGPAAVYETPPPAAAIMEPPLPGMLRWISVQERAGADRTAAPVRVPVFFSAGECRSPDELRLVPWPEGAPVPFQADDIRRGADGGVARLHLWIRTDLSAGQTRRFALVRAAGPQDRESARVQVEEEAGHLTLVAGGTSVVFFRQGAETGRLAGLRLQDGPALEFADGAFFEEKPPAGATPRSTLAWGSGPVFAKVEIRTPGPGHAEIGQTWRLFADGTLDLIRTESRADPADVAPAREPLFWQGRLDTAELELRRMPAGMVDELADFHPGYQVDLLAAKGRERGWLVVPAVLGGGYGRVELEHDRLALRAPDESGPPPKTLRARWTQVTLVPVSSAGSRQALKAAGQPLVAVVDRPELGLSQALERIKDNVREMKPVGWVNEAVVRWLAGRPEPFPRRNWSAEAEAGHWIAAAQRAEAKVMAGATRPLREDEKGRAAGPLDPYHATYGATPLAAWLWREALPDPVLASLRAQTVAWRRHLGRVDEGGWPYLDVFHRTQNMQMGPALLALADRQGEPGNRAFYRDLLRSPPIAVVMLRGFRPYAGVRQTRDDPSDTIYQAVVDFMLRAAELCAGETLGSHPLSAGRYLDAVDVNADLFHPAHPRHADDGRHFARANFFRVQAHPHRWLAWGPAPFIALLQDPLETGFSPGVTEAWRYADGLVGRWKNWPDQSWLFLAGVLPPQAAMGMPSPPPGAVRALRVTHGGEGNRLAWTDEREAAAWRIYRFRNGQAPVWLNSPYVRPDGEPSPVKECRFLDRAGRPGDRYVVHGVDASGREGAW